MTKGQPPGPHSPLDQYLWDRKLFLLDFDLCKSNLLVESEKFGQPPHLFTRPLLPSLPTDLQRTISFSINRNAFHNWRIRAEKKRNWRISGKQPNQFAPAPKITDVARSQSNRSSLARQHERKKNNKKKKMPEINWSCVIFVIIFKFSYSCRSWRWRWIMVVGRLLAWQSNDIHVAVAGWLFAEQSTAGFDVLPTHHQYYNNYPMFTSSVMMAPTDKPFNRKNSKRVA